jgi:hypothetical protein
MNEKKKGLEELTMSTNDAVYLCEHHCGGRQHILTAAYRSEIAALEKEVHYAARLERVLKGYRLLAQKCAQCGGALAYKGAIYCGAGCCARSEAHEPVGFEEIDERQRR